MVRCAAVCLCCTILDRRPQRWTFYEGMQRSTARRSKGLVKGAFDCLTSYNWNRLPLRPGPPQGAKDCLTAWARKGLLQGAKAATWWSEGLPMPQRLPGEGKSGWRERRTVWRIEGLVKLHNWIRLPPQPGLLEWGRTAWGSEGLVKGAKDCLKERRTGQNSQTKWTSTAPETSWGSDRTTA